MKTESTQLQFNPDQDWVSNHAPRWFEHLKHLVKRDDVRGLEIGTWEGRSAHWFLSNILVKDNSSLITVDRSHSAVEKNKGLLKAIHGKRFKAIECNAFDFLLDVLQGNENPEQFDFIYLDAPKDSADLLEITPLLWRLLKENGIMIFDDYGWPNHNTEKFSNESPKHWCNPPRVGIDAFLTCYYDRLKTLHKDWQVIVKKTR